MRYYEQAYYFNNYHYCLFINNWIVRNGGSELLFFKSGR